MRHLSGRDVHPLRWALVAWLALAAPPARGAEPAVEGQWGPLMMWPGPATHAHLLPTGKVLFFPEQEYGDNPRTWDPTTGAVEDVPRAGFNIFCSGHAFLPDGRLFLAGGHVTNYVGLERTILFDPATERWTPGPDMNAPRWYPTVTTLPNGDLLVLSGTIDPSRSNELPQVYQPASHTWRNLTGAQKDIPYYPWMFVAPDGNLFMAGPRGRAQFLDTRGTGAWTWGPYNAAGSRPYGSAVMYDEGRVLIVGGGDPPKATAEVIDVRAPTPTWRATGSLHRPRRQANATLLPDGTVLVTGGSSGAGFDNRDAPVKEAELWDPATGQWTVLAPEERYRGYHSSALLLPDGRVLSAGGRMREPTAQVFSPPYLFKGPRPTVDAAPDSVAWGASFTVRSPDAASISRVTLLRLSSVTHAFNMNQRINSLSFSRDGDAFLNVTAPANANLCPPGHYLLFLVNERGVPSVGRVLRVGGDAPPPPPPPPSTGFAYGATWKYHDGAVDLGTAWLAPGYDDAAWKSGAGQLGYGDGDERTRLTRRTTTASQPSVYFRKTLRLDAPVKAASLKALYDDGLAVWVNGTLVLSRNMGNGTGYAAWASAASGDNTEVSAALGLSPNPFVVGDNVIAVMVKQVDASSSDTSFDLALSLTFGAPGDPPPLPGIALGSEWKYHDGAVDLGTAWLAPGYDDAAWKAGPAQLGYGDGDERTRLTRRTTTASQPSVYFRKTLHLDRAVTAASLQVLFDDAFAVWVNGTLVLSRNVGNGTGYAAWASASSGDNAVVSAPVPLSPNPFVVGANVVAVIVKQTEAASSDTSFDLELKLEGAP